MTYRIKLEALLPDIVLKNPQNTVLRSLIPEFKNFNPGKLKLVNLDKDTFAKSKVSAKGIIYRLDEMTGRDKIHISPETYFFRDDIEWREFGPYLREKYKNDPKVNFYQFASSRGEESYSTIIAIMREFKNEANKFLPIKAFGINHDIIETAKELQKEHFEGYIVRREVIDGFEKMGLNKQDFIPYFEHSDDLLFLKLKPKVTEAVTFKHANILDEWRNIDDKHPSVVMCRNMWPYVDEKEHLLIAQNLYNRLAKNSSVIIGGYDNCAGSWMHIARKLKNVGFTPSEECTTGHSMGNIIFEK